jgi:PAS domain S-box-containing protein
MKTRMNKMKTRMKNLPAEKNRRILVVDDNHAIHDDFRKILSPATKAAAALDVTEAELFGKAVPHGGMVQPIRYEIDSAYQGQDGVLLVKQALEAGRPYAMAFVDVRMPPGMDGVETARKMWELDPDLQVVLCTAYSDYSWGEMFEKLGRHDGLLILKKPFDTVEALQLAHALTEKWWLHQQSRRKMEDLEDMVATRTQELAKSLSLLNATLESTADGILVLDLSGKISSFNARFAAMWRFPAELLKRRDTAKIVPYVSGQLKDPEKFLQQIKKSQSDPEAETFESFECKDGRVFERYSLPRRIDSKCVGVVVNWRDVTERKRAEEALHESEEKHRRLFDSSKDAFMTLAPPDWRFTSGNPSTVAMFRAGDEAEFVSKAPWELSPERQPDGRLSAEKAKAMIEQAMREGNHYFEWTHKRLDGEEFPATVLLTRLELKGRLLLNACVRDITERKRVEAELNRERDLWRTLLDNSPDHIYFKDAHSRFIKASKAQARQFGVESPDEMLGKTDFDFFDEAHARPAFEDEQEIIRTGRPMIAKEEREVWKDGHVTWASSTKMPLHDDTGKIIGIMGISRDITERKRLETHLIQSQKMETVGKLAGGIAHEFNSILTAIIGQSELLLGDLPAGSPLAKNAAEISRAADRAAVLTRQLLAYGRKQFLRPEALNLNQVIGSMGGVLSHLMGGEMVDVNIIPAAGLQMVKADAGQIEQVIMNLAMNARDAMPHGGKLTLETANVTLDQEYVSRFPELTAGEYVMLAVTDTGRGMSEKVKAHAFEPFFTTKDVGQGTGLGLSTCYGIIKQSGGHISVYSEPGRGTTFKIYLPQVEPPPKTPLAHLDSSDLPRGTETILLVEDDPALREMAATLLRRLGYTVLEAANGIEALSLKQQRDVGHVDLLFTDVVMPHMSGKELSDRVRALYPHTRILFTSAYTENAIVHQGVLDKGVALLQKPFTPSALALKVRETLDAPTAPNPAPAQKTSDEAMTPGN